MHTRFFFLISLLFGSFLGSFFLVSAADFGGIGGRPAHPDLSGPTQSKQWFFYTLGPGESRADELLLQNSTNEKVKVLLYSADSTPSTDGGFALEQMVESRDFVGAWVTLSETEIELEPNEAKIIPFTIAVPDDPALDVGEHTGGILIQKVQSEDSEQAGLQLLTRVGVRIYVTVPGNIVKKLELNEFSLERLEGKKTFVVTTSIINSGNVSSDLLVKTEVQNLIPFLSRFFPEYPMQNERKLQVLRESELTSNFEFPRPFFGKIAVSGSVLDESDGTEFSTGILEMWVFPDKDIILLAVLMLALIASLVTLIILRSYAKKAKIPKKAKKKNRHK